MRSLIFSSPVLLGTSNRGKLSEISVFARQLGFEVIGLADESLISLGCPPHVAEVAHSYEGNARLKGLEYSKWSKRACITDDTGIEIPLLANFPGVFTAPWGIVRVRDLLGGRRVVEARFRCCMAYTEPSGRCVSVSGSIDGELRDLDVIDAMQPLPFSRFFYPLGLASSLHELLEKGLFQYSHRYRAFDTLVRVLS